MKNRILTLLFLVLSSSVFSQDQAILLLKVENSGIQSVTVQDASALGIDLTGIQVSNLSLKNNGQTVPFYINNLDGGKITSTSEIQFIGHPLDSLYQKHANYYLTFDSGVLIKSIENSPASQTLNLKRSVETQQPNLIYNVNSYTSDPWHAYDVLAIDSPASQILEFEITQKYQNQHDVRVSIQLKGGTDYPQELDHFVQIKLNGTVMGDLLFDGLEFHELTYTVSSDLLFNGTNSIEVLVPNSTGVFADLIHIESWSVNSIQQLWMKQDQISIDGVSQADHKTFDTLFVNSFESSNAHIQVHNAKLGEYSIYSEGSGGIIEIIENFEFGDSCTNQQSNDCTIDFISNPSHKMYFAEQNQLFRPELSIPVLNEDISFANAQYLIITHPDFLGPSLDQFVNYKSEKYSVNVVSVEQIYSQLGYYNSDAIAIHEYIRWAQQSMNTQYVLLIGGDSYDYHNNLGLDSMSFIPTLYMPTDELITFAPVDAKYADVNNDLIPDLSLGRLPVRSEQELSIALQKIYDYDQKTYSETAIIGADKYDTSRNYSFLGDAEGMISHLPEVWQQNLTDDFKAYMDYDGLQGSRNKIINAINNGVSLTSFIGHTGKTAWSFSRVLKNSHVNQLTNASNPTLVTQWGCWNSYYVSPYENTMAHAFILNPNGGAVASLGSSTLTKAESEKELSKLVFRFLINEQKTIGEAVLLAKKEFAIKFPDNLDVILGWNILGDPSIKL